MNITKMPWGKYKGSSISTLPSKYLYWLATDDKVFDYPHGEDLAIEADDEWQFREKNNTHKGKRKYNDE